MNRRAAVHRCDAAPWEEWLRATAITLGFLCGPPEPEKLGFRKLSEHAVAIVD